MRRRSWFHALLAALAVTLLPAAVPTAASAVPTAAPAASAADSAASRLRLAVHQGTSADGRVIDRAVLECGPPGGTHPRPGQACRTLERVDGRFERLRPLSGACTMVYDPVTVTARGHWHDRTMVFEGTYDNRCMAEQATRRVFAF